MSDCRKCNKICLTPKYSLYCICCDGRVCLDCLTLSQTEITSYLNGESQYLCETCSAIYPCRVCSLPCEDFPDKEASIQCDFCECWEHAGCSELKYSQFNKLGKSNDAYFCKACVEENLPFTNVANIHSEFNITSAKTSLTTTARPCSLCIECNDECETCETSCPDLYRVCNSCLPCNYNNINQLNTILSSRKENQLALLHMNASSLTLDTNLDRIRNLVDDVKNKPEIICISESRIKQKTKLDTLNIQGYKLNVHNNSTSQAGGTCIYTKEECVFKHRKDLDFNVNGEAEASFIEIEAVSKLSKNTVIGCLYRHPHENHDIFFDRFAESVEKVNKSVT